MNYFASKKAKLVLIAFFLLNSYVSSAHDCEEFKFASEKDKEEHEKVTELLEPTISQLSFYFKQRNRNENLSEDIKNIAAAFKYVKVSESANHKQYLSLNKHIVRELGRTALCLGYKSLERVPVYDPQRSNCNILQASVHFLSLAAKGKIDEMEKNIKQVLPCYIFVFVTKKLCDSSWRAVVTQGLNQQERVTIKNIFENYVKEATERRISAAPSRQTKKLRGRFSQNPGRYGYSNQKDSPAKRTKRSFKVGFLESVIVVGVAGTCIFIILFWATCRQERANNDLDAPQANNPVAQPASLAPVLPDVIVVQHPPGEGNQSGLTVLAVPKPLPREDPVRNVRDHQGNHPAQPSSVPPQVFDVENPRALYDHGE